MAELTNKVQPLEPNFTQSFGPLTNVWLPLFGVRLNAIGRSAIYGFVMYYIYWNGDEMLDGYVGDRRNVTINWTFQWNLLLDYSNGAIRTTGSYAAAILLFRKHWHLLENSLNETERLFPFQFQRNLYRKCHRLSLVAIAYIIVSTGIILVFAALEMTKEEASFGRMFVEITSQVLAVYPVSILTLFCLLCHALAHQFRAIGERLKETSDGDVNKIRLLQRQHFMACRSVRLINRCFGTIMLFEIPTIFIGILHGMAHWMVVSTLNLGWFLYLLTLFILFSHVVDFILIVMVAEKLKREADDLKPTLYQLIYDKSALRTEIESFTEQISQLKPEISAEGFFVVDKRIFPAVIGAMLTYFLVMFQFHS